MKTLIVLTAMAALAAPMVALAADAPAAAAPAAAAPKFTASSTLGSVMADPAARAVLFKSFPEISQAPEDQLAMGAGLSLQDLQQYVPSMTNDALRKFEQDVAKPAAPAAAGAGATSSAMPAEAPKPPEAPKPTEPPKPAQ
ncbi:MAG: hypothetical protein JWM33_2764 [Caulobacteraceae bacterium]|nr:hypothetical protein [Caulobacteraceae bacterium]